MMNVTFSGQPEQPMWALAANGWALPVAAAMTNIVMNWFAEWGRRVILPVGQNWTWTHSPPDEQQPLADKVDATYQRVCRFGVTLGSLGAFLCRNPLPLALGSALCARSTQAQSPGDLEWSYPDVTFDLTLNDSIVMAHGKGTLVALDPATGQPIWNQTANNQLVIGDRVYILSSAGLYAFDAYTGKQLWSSPAEGSHMEISQDETILYSYGYGIDGSLSALHAETGQSLWSSFNASGIHSLLIVKERICIIPSAARELYSLNASTGQQLWNFSTTSLGPSLQVSTLSVVGDKVLVAYVSLGWSTLLNALSLFTGQQLWVGTLPVVDHSLLYQTTVQIGGEDDLILSSVTDTWEQNQSMSASCIAVTNASTGQLIFNTPWTEGLLLFTPLLNGTLYWCSSRNGTLQAINGSTGALLWQSNISCGPSAPIAIDDSIYVNGVNALSSLNATTGLPFWQLVNGNYSGPMILAAGILYLGNVNEEKIFAVQAQTGALLWNSPILPALDLIKSLNTVQERLYVSTDRALVVLYAGAPFSTSKDFPTVEVVAVVSSVAFLWLAALGAKRVQKCNRPMRRSESAEYISME